MKKMTAVDSKLDSLGGDLNTFMTVDVKDIKNRFDDLKSSQCGLKDSHIAAVTTCAESIIHYGRVGAGGLSGLSGVIPESRIFERGFLTHTYLSFDAGDVVSGIYRFCSESTTIGATRYFG